MPTTRPEPELVLLLSDPWLPDAARARELMGTLIDWNEVIGTLVMHRTVGVAWRNMLDHRLTGEDVLRPNHVCAVLEVLFEAQRQRAADHADLCATLVAALDEGGVPSAIMKGCGVAHLGYRDPGMRIFNDVDLLVDRADLSKANDILEKLGYRQGSWDRSTAGVIPASRKDVLLYSVGMHQTHPYVKQVTGGRVVTWHEVDVHFSVDLRSNVGSATTGTLLGRRVQVELRPGRRAWIIDPVDMFVFLCVHFCRDARLREEVDLLMDLVLYKLADLLALLGRPGCPMSPDEIAVRATELAFAREVTYALGHLRALYPNRLPHEFGDPLMEKEPFDLNLVKDREGAVYEWTRGIRERFFDPHRVRALRRRGIE